MGDAVLQAVAAALAGEVRASDVIGRLGGDELAILLWNVSELQLLQGRGVGANGRGGCPAICPYGSLSRSLGRRCDAGPSDTCASVIARADRAMYARKALRRAARR